MIPGSTFRGIAQKLVYSERLVLLLLLQKQKGASRSAAWLDCLRKWYSQAWISRPVGEPTSPFTWPRTGKEERHYLLLQTVLLFNPLCERKINVGGTGGFFAVLSVRERGVFCQKKTPRSCSILCSFRKTFFLCSQKEEKFPRPRLCREERSGKKLAPFLSAKL